MAFLPFVCKHSHLCKTQAIRLQSEDGQEIVSNLTPGKTEVMLVRKDDIVTECTCP